LLLCALAHAETPVVVELFTSEGCSSCPPADLLLARLESTQPVPGAHIIVLSEHVDYWNRLGWRDPFSSVRFSDRQQSYSQVFHDEGPYTPEMVVDGAAGFVGSESGEALRRITQAARIPKARVRITGSAERLSIEVDGLPRTAEVLLAMTEGNLISNVSRGENAGRKLTHTAVVRKLQTVGKTKKGEPFRADVRLNPENTWVIENLRAVVLVQESSSRRIVAVGEAAGLRGTSAPQ
jgi:hypothetical protein